MSSPAPDDGPEVRTYRLDLRDPAEIGAFYGGRSEFVPVRDGYHLGARGVVTPSASLEWLSHRGHVVVDEDIPDRQFFALVGSGRGELSLDGVRVTPRSMIAASRRPRIARLEGSVDYAIVSVPGSWVDTGPASFRELDPATVHLGRLSTLLGQVRSMLDAGALDESRLAAAGESVADVLHHVVAAAQPTPDRLDRGTAEQIVCDAIAAIREGRARTVGELTVEAATSRSTLYRSFDAVLGVSPYDYMQRRRLVRLRRRLLEVDAEPGVVTREAARVGSFHLGNLAGSYRRLFGELPSDTVSRSTAGRRTRRVGERPDPTSPRGVTDRG